MLVPAPVEVDDEFRSHRDRLLARLRLVDEEVTRSVLTVLPWMVEEAYPDAAVLQVEEYADGDRWHLVVSGVTDRRGVDLDVEGALSADDGLVASAVAALRGENYDEWKAFKTADGHGLDLARMRAAAVADAEECGAFDEDSWYEVEGELEAFLEEQDRIRSQVPRLALTGLTERVRAVYPSARWLRAEVRDGSLAMTGLRSGDDEDLLGGNPVEAVLADVRARLSLLGGRNRDGWERFTSVDDGEHLFDLDELSSFLAGPRSRRSW